MDIFNLKITGRVQTAGREQFYSGSKTSVSKFAVIIANKFEAGLDIRVIAPLRIYLKSDETPQRLAIDTI